MSGMGWSAALARRGRFFWVAAAVRPSGGGHAAVRVLLAVVFFVAAALKGHELATGPLLGDGLLASRPVLIALVEFEWVLGLCMLFGLYPKRTWQVALACFSVFACVSLYKGIVGDASCGCFGRVEVSPWYTLALDVGAVIALLVWPPRDRAPGDEPVRGDAKRLLGLSRVGGVVAVALLIGVPGAVAMATYRAATLGDDGMIVGPGNVVVLEPDKWVGKRFPLLPFIVDYPGGRSLRDPPLRNRVAKGNWMVVLYNHDCPKCLEAMPKYEELARFSATSETGETDYQVILIEVPPYGDRHALPLSLDAPCLLGRLSDEKEWFVETPCFLIVSESIARLVDGT